METMELEYVQYSPQISPSPLSLPILTLTLLVSRDREIGAQFSYWTCRHGDTMGSSRSIKWDMLMEQISKTLRSEMRQQTRGSPLLPATWTTVPPITCLPPVKLYTFLP
jgi:hypothetical protein